MNFFALTGILIGLSSSVMAVVMFVIARKRFHYLWALFNIVVIFWGLGVYKVATSQDIAQADLWWRLAHIGVILIPAVFVHFIYAFLEIKKRFLIITSYVLALFFLYVNFSGNLFIVNMRWVFDQFYYDSPPGVLYTPFTVFFFGVIGYAHWLLWRTYQTATQDKKLQISYFFLATTLGFIGGGLSFLPVYQIDVYPYSNITVSLYMIILTYAIIKKRLFDIRIVLTQLLVSVIAVLLLINFILSQAFFDYLWKGGLLLAFLVAGYSLVRSVLKEIKARNQIEQLATELKIANQKLKKLDKTKSEFISIASHQLRTPLTAIKGYIGMILEGVYGHLQPSVKDALNKVFLSNERLVGLVNELLDISRIERGKFRFDFQTVDINNLLKGVVEELGAQARAKGLTLVYQAHPLPKITADPSKLRHVFINLIDNAIRYTDQGSIKLRAKADQENLTISIIDTGVGMSAEVIGKLFKGFQRGENVAKHHPEGTGIGLYVAKQIVDAHHGRIRAESPGPGQGSTFLVILPLALPALAALPVQPVEEKAEM